MDESERQRRGCLPTELGEAVEELDLGVSTQPPSRLMPVSPPVKCSLVPCSSRLAMARELTMMRHEEGTESVTYTLMMNPVETLVVSHMPAMMTLVHTAPTDVDAHFGRDRTLPLGNSVGVAWERGRWGWGGC